MFKSEVVFWKEDGKVVRAAQKCGNFKKSTTNGG